MASLRGFVNINDNLKDIEIGKIKGVDGYGSRSFLPVTITLDLEGDLFDTLYRDNNGLCFFFGQQMRVGPYSHLLYAPIIHDITEANAVTIGSYIFIPCIATFQDSNNFAFNIWYNRSSNEFERSSISDHDEKLVSYEVTGESTEHSNWYHEMTISFLVPIYTIFKCGLDLSKANTVPVFPEWTTNNITGELDLFCFAGNIAYSDYMICNLIHYLTTAFEQTYNELQVDSDNLHFYKINDINGLSNDEELTWARNNLKVTVTTDNQGRHMLFFSLPADHYDFHNYLIFNAGDGGPSPETYMIYNTIPAYDSVSHYPFVYHYGPPLSFAYLLTTSTKSWTEIFSESYDDTYCNSIGDAERCLAHFYEIPSGFDLSNNFKWVNKWYYDTNDYLEFGTGAKNVPIASLRFARNGYTLQLINGYGNTWV